LTSRGSDPFLKGNMPDLPSLRPSRRRYAICGISTRSVVHFLLPLLGIPSSFSGRDFSGVGEVVGVLDCDPERMRVMNERCGTNIPSFADFGAMLREARPEVILVGVPDSHHAGYILKALANDLDVIVEKPMVIHSAQARAILEAEARSRGRVRVAFNMRYHPYSLTARRFIREGHLGKIANIEFAFNIDTRHGSSYFYRWNRVRENSGGLSIHKGCHHFDLIGWLIEDRPETVFAFGKRNFYGPDGALRPRSADGETLPRREERLRCPYYNRHMADAFGPDENPATKWDPLDLPYHQQYPDERKRYIYDPEINIEDTYSAVIGYRGGASMAYSCNFSAAWEGYRLAINGSGGRLEVALTSRTFGPGGMFEAPPAHQEMTFYPLFGGRQTLKVEVHSAGGHGGADPLIQEDMFNEGKGNGAIAGLCCYSGAVDGAYAVATGEALWRSIAEKRPVSIGELLGGGPE